MQNIPELEETARSLRKLVIQMLTKAASGHPGGSLSAADITTALYFRVLNHDPKNPKWDDRDRLVLSKGHAVPIVYSALATSGYFPKDELMTLRQINSRMQGHPDMQRTPGIEACTGSLGQGLSIGAGMALGARWQKKSFRTYVLMSDGETNEGQTWEAAAFASFRKLDHLTAILDYNKFQLDGSTCEVLSMEPMAERWRSFGWAVREMDGHDMRQIVEGLDWARQNEGKPSMLIAHTVKGKGVSFMENNNHFHGVAPTAAEAEWALKELDGLGTPPPEFLATVKRGAK
ncbi:MAG: transketolase [Candidatus Omnitrophica bacterium]|nr:transketolase [Candidatus Omnitrophota bacterium]